MNGAATLTAGFKFIPSGPSAFENFSHFTPKSTALQNKLFKGEISCSWQLHLPLGHLSCNFKKNLLCCLNHTMLNLT